MYFSYRAICKLQLHISIIRSAYYQQKGKRFTYKQNRLWGFLKVETHINISSHYCLPAHPYSLTVCRVNFGHKRNECVRLSRLSSVAGAGVFVAIFNVTGDLPLKYHCTWKLYYICNFCSSMHFLTQFKLYLRKRSYNYSFK